MVVGCLGQINFRVSSEYVQTIERMQYSRSARTAVHQRHNTSALTEFTGYDPAAITFDCYLDRSLGISDVMREADRFEEYMKEGRAVSFVLGNKIYGEYRWLIQSSKVVPVYYDGRGVVIAAKVTVSIIEYTRGTV